MLLAASMKAITRKWFKQERPTLDNWIDVTKEIYTTENITFLVHLKKDAFLGGNELNMYQKGLILLL